MGIKSTITLTRNQAVEKYTDLMIARAELRRIYRATAEAMSLTELEDVLEELDDEQAGGESFNNYRIIVGG